jgi:hypothetical protein
MGRPSSSEVYWSVLAVGSWDGNGRGRVWRVARRIRKYQMPTIKKIAKKLLQEYGDKAEIAMLSFFNKIAKAKYEDRFVTVVGLGFKDNYFYMKGQIDTSFPKSRGIYRARDILKENMFITKGPLPTCPPHRAILVPFPSLLMAGIGPLRDISKEWKGFTFSYDLPYIEYTIAK